MKKYYTIIGQKFSEDKYFYSRPSAVDYNAAGAGGSNKGPTNSEYLKIVKIELIHLKYIILRYLHLKFLQIWLQRVEAVLIRIFLFNLQIFRLNGLLKYADWKKAKLKR